jgi:hypothetical protein
MAQQRAVEPLMNENLHCTGRVTGLFTNWKGFGRGGRGLVESLSRHFTGGTE